MIDNKKNTSEVKAYQKILQIKSFKNENGIDQMKQQIDLNYKQIKQDILEIIQSELKRISNDSNLN